MIEAANKQIKYHFLHHKEILNFEQLEHYLHTLVADYNNRPHDAINGLTPIEELNGKLPSQVNFAIQIAKAKSGRILENRPRKCCNSSF